MTSDTPRRPRRLRGPHLTTANLAVLAWLAVSVAAFAARGRLPAGPWLALHALLLGAVTNAIVAYSDYFTRSLLRVPGPPAGFAFARLAALNASAVAVLTGVALGRPVVTLFGALGLVAVVTVYAIWLISAARRPFGSALAGTVWYYVAAGGALLAGIGLGALMVGGGASVAGAAVELRLAHAHCNLLGWVGLTLLGTQFTFVPTVLRTRIAPGAARTARTALPLAVVGLAVAVGALLAGWQRAAAAGAGLYAAAVLVGLAPAWLALRARRDIAGGAAWSLAAALGWLAAGSLADAALLAATPTLPDAAASLARLLPTLAAAFAAQAVAGALTYLLPMLWGRGAHGNRQLTAVLDRWWPWRLAAVNIGAVLTLVPPPGGWPAALGWGLVAAGVGGFVLLAVVAAVTAARLRRDGAGEPSSRSWPVARDPGS